MSTSSTDNPVRDEAHPVPTTEIAVRISEFIEVVEEHIHEVGVVSDVDPGEEPDEAGQARHG